MNYVPQTVMQPVPQWEEATKGYTPLKFISIFGPCSAKHVATRLGLCPDYVTRRLRKACNIGHLAKELRLEEVGSQLRRVAFYSEVK